MSFLTEPDEKDWNNQKIKIQDYLGKKKKRTVIKPPLKKFKNYLEQLPLSIIRNKLKIVSKNCLIQYFNNIIYQPMIHIKSFNNKVAKFMVYIYIYMYIYCNSISRSAWLKFDKLKPTTHKLKIDQLSIIRLSARFQLSKTNSVRLEVESTKTAGC